MKYNQYLSAAFAFALSAFGMVSCYEDIESPEIENIPGKKVHMSINVSRENLAPDTKGEFNIDENGKLKFSWDSNDVIEVRGEVYGNMQHLGTLTLDGTGNGAAGNFSGDVELIGETGDYHFYYLGEKSVGENDTKCEFILPHQDMTLAGLAKSDVQRAKATLTYASNGLIGDVSLARAFAFATVTVTLPNGVMTPASGVDVTFTGEGISSTAQVSLTDASAAVTNTATSNAGVTLKMNGNVNSQKFYMNILPGTLKNLKVTTEINGKTYSAEKLTDSSKTTVANTNYNIAFTMEEENEPVVLDGTIFGLKWAPSNNRSYIDASKRSSYFWPITYIPNIPLSSQGYTVHYINDVLDSDDNAKVYHYQWDRDFGFVAGVKRYDLCIRDNEPYMLPNYTNMPFNYNDDDDVMNMLYDFAFTNQGYNRDTENANYNVMIYPNNLNDWSSETKTTWGNRLNTKYEITSSPNGFRIPTKDEWLTLMPNRSYNTNETFTSIDGFELIDTDDNTEGTIYPFKAKSLNDGTSVVWSVWNTTTKPYLDVRRIVGTFTDDDLSDLNSVNMESDSYVKLPADGFTGNSTTGAKDSFGARGIYWASDSPDATSGTSYAFTFVITKKANKYEISMATLAQPRKVALSVRCLYDE